MSIKVKAIERNVSFEKGKQNWAYVMQPDLYGQLSAQKVIEEASVRSGMSKAVLNASWIIIGDVIRAWATEGHSVAVPGLGSMRFGLRATSVADVNKVSTSLITSRRVLFVPTTEIKQELANTPILITCYDRTGKIVKQVNSADSAGDDGSGDHKGDNTQSGGGSTTGGGSQTGGGSTSGGDNNFD